MRCDRCDRELNPAVDTVFQAVTGWVKLRDAGGANAVAGRVAEQQFRCRGCMATAPDPGQGVLFGG